MCNEDCFKNYKKITTTLSKSLQFRISNKLSFPLISFSYSSLLKTLLCWLFVAVQDLLAPIVLISRTPSIRSACVLSTAVVLNLQFVTFFPNYQPQNFFVPHTLSITSLQMTPKKSLFSVLISILISNTYSNAMYLKFFFSSPQEIFSLLPDLPLFASSATFVSSRFFLQNYFFSSYLSTFPCFSIPTVF